MRLALLILVAVFAFAPAAQADWYCPKPHRHVHKHKPSAGHYKRHRCKPRKVVNTTPPGPHGPTTPKKTPGIDITVVIPLPL